jgi:hypothetical protein
MDSVSVDIDPACCEACEVAVTFATKEVIGGSRSRLLPTLVPVLVVQNLLDVQSILALLSIRGDPVDEYGHFRHWRIHSVQQSQFEWL